MSDASPNNPSDPHCLERYPSLVTLLMSEIVTIPFLKRPFQDLTNPLEYGLENGTNHRIPVLNFQSGDDASEDGQSLGAWYFRPKAPTEETDVVSEGSIHKTYFKHPETTFLVQILKLVSSYSRAMLKLTTQTSCSTRKQLFNTTTKKADSGHELISSCAFFLVSFQLGPIPSPLGADDTLFVYYHGNAETRSQWHRRELYKVTKI